MRPLHEYGLIVSCICRDLQSDKLQTRTINFQHKPGSVPVSVCYIYRSRNVAYGTVTSRHNLTGNLYSLDSLRFEDGWLLEIMNIVCNI